MSKKEFKVKVSVNAEGDVNIKLTDEERNRIPRPGDSLYIIQPYPQIDPEDIDGNEITEDDVKGKQIMGYSYDSTMVKASVLSDELDEVIVNGDYRIPLKRNTLDPNKKLMVFTNEEDAKDKYRTLMTVSLNETKRRIELYNNIQNNIQESLEKMYH